MSTCTKLGVAISKKTIVKIYENSTNVGNIYMFEQLVFNLMKHNRAIVLDLQKSLNLNIWTNSTIFKTLNPKYSSPHGYIILK